MRRPAACLALLAFVLAPIAYAAEPTDSPDPMAPTELPTTVVPVTPFTPLPTASIEVCDLGNCAQEDLRATTFYLDPDPQACMSYCASNDWTFLSYCDAGRGVYLCFCCAG
jgi:hypothetical protein